MTSLTCAGEFIGLAELELSGGELAISDDDLASVMTAAVRLYASRAEARDTFPPPLVREKVTATDVAVVVSEMVQVVDLNMFDLSMWHARTRSRTR
jgi:hypothetical protein